MARDGQFSPMWLLLPERLRRAARDGIGDHAIDPDSGQSQRDQREDPQQVVMTRGPAKEAETISSIVRMWYGGRS